MFNASRLLLLKTSVIVVRVGLSIGGMNSPAADATADATEPTNWRRPWRKGKFNCLDSCSMDESIASEVDTALPLRSK